MHKNLQLTEQQVGKQLHVGTVPMWTQLSVHWHDRVTCLCLSFSIQICLCGHLSVLTFLLTHHFQTLPLTMLLTDSDHPSLTPSQFPLFRLSELYSADILMSGFHPCEAVYVRICPRGHVYSRSPP